MINPALSTLILVLTISFDPNYKPIKKRHGHWPPRSHQKYYALSDPDLDDSMDDDDSDIMSHDDINDDNQNESED
jgi:hypothetical protein